MKKAIFILIAFASFCAKAQITFEKSIHYSNIEEIALSATEDGQGGYIVAIGKKRGSSSQNYSFGLIHLNGYGDTLWYKSFQVNYHPEIKLVRKSIDSYYVMGINDDTAQNNASMYWINKFDTMGNLIWENYYSNNLLPGTEDRNGMSINIDGSIFLVNNEASFLAVDSSGALMNVFHASNYYPSFIEFETEKLFKKNGVYHILSAYSANFPFNAQFRVLKINSNADTLSSYKFNVDSARGRPRIMKGLGNDLIILGYSNTGIRNFFLSKIDSIGSIIWNKKINGLSYFYSYINSYAELKNGNVVICGFPKITGSLTTPPEGKAFLYCFNDNGDSLWYKEFRADTLHKTEFYDIIATADSGILACGQILMPDNSRRSYIVKLDSDGYLYNPLSIVEKKKETYLHIYPNPADAYTSFHYMGLKKNVHLTVYNVEGKLMDSFQLNGNDARLTISTTRYPPGVYSCNLSADETILVSKKLSVIR
ncbi:MAG: T9SS type A sorting domain-containing protein [Bacteroidetes bacterium]|nr:T9SS type A sorting domain-containing protein [Bacteroidota bacterium]